MVYGNTATELKVQEMGILPKIRVRITKDDESKYTFKVNVDFSEEYNELTVLDRNRRSYLVFPFTYYNSLSSCLSYSPSP